METETKFPGPIALLKQAWQIYKSRFWVLVGIYIIPAVLVIALTLVAGGGAVAGSLLGIKASPVLLVTVIVLAVLIYLAVIYISLWSQTALLFAVKGADQKVGFKESFSQASNKVFSVLGASLLVGLAIFGLMLVSGAVIFVLYMVLPKMAILFFVEGILGLLAALWAIKLGLEFSLATYVVVGDNTRALSAIQRSRDYVKGHWWGVFGRMLFLLVLALVYIIVVVLITAIFKAIPGAAGQILSMLVTLALDVILPPLFVAYAYLIYSHLRVVKGESQIPADKKSVGLIILAVIVMVIFALGIFFGLSSIIYNYGNSVSKAPYFQNNQAQTLSPQQMQELQQMEQQYQMSTSTATSSYQ